MPQLATVEEAAQHVSRFTPGERARTVAELLSLGNAPWFWIDAPPWEDDRRGYWAQALFIHGAERTLTLHGEHLIVHRLTGRKGEMVTAHWTVALIDVRFDMNELGDSLTEPKDPIVLKQATPSDDLLAQVERRDSGLDYSVLVSKHELVAAFGPFTGMDASWFANLTDTPGLFAARKVEGKGGRNHIPPLFCPFAVMQWLIDPKRRKGRPLKPETGWRLLQSHFARVYNIHSVGDPRTD